MITENIGMIKTFTDGSSKFEFNLKSIVGNVKSDFHIVKITQTVNFTDEEVKEFGLNENKTVISYTYKVPVRLYPTEFCAINFCGKKLLKRWVNIS